jgi:hypothetical protein
METTNKFISKTTFGQPLYHSGLSRILLLSERFPTGGNDNHMTLFMNSIVSSENSRGISPRTRVSQARCLNFINLLMFGFMLTIR